MTDRPRSPASATWVEMTQIVMPQDTNSHGTLFGGRVLEWIDIAGGVAARRHARMPVVTASIDQVDFLEPIGLGEFVILKACVNFAGRSSMEVGVYVEVETPDTGERRPCHEAYLTYVALDSERVPQVVPELVVTTDEERERFEAAAERRRYRLERRHG